MSAHPYDLAAKIFEKGEAGEADTVYLPSEAAAAPERLDPTEKVILGGPGRISETIFD